MARSSGVFMSFSIPAIVDSFSIKASKSINKIEKMSIRKKIRDGRLLLKMTEQQFADSLDVSRGTVQQWEKQGGTAPARKRQSSVAKLLGISVSELMHDSSEQTRSETRNITHDSVDFSAASIDHLAAALRQFDAPARERAAVLLQGLARDPDGPWAAWLTELLAKPPESTRAAATTKVPKHAPLPAHSPIPATSPRRKSA